YTFRIPSIAAAARIFVNAHREIENWVVSEDLRQVVPYLRTQYLQLPLAGPVELVVQVSNAHFKKGGIWQPISLAHSQAMDGFRLSGVLADVFVIVALLTFALYYIFLSLLRNPEKSALYYGIFCLVVAIESLFSGERLFSVLFPSIPWDIAYRIELFCNFTDALFFYFFLRYFFPEIKQSSVLKGMAGVAILFSLATLTLPVSLLRFLKEPFQIFIATAILYVFFLLIKQAIRKIYGARIFLLGLVVVAIGFSNDVLKNTEHITTPYLFSYSILIFTMLQAVLISGKSMRLFHENAELSKKLIEADKFKDEFFAQTSHELRTPVQAIVQTVENIRRGNSGSIAEKAQETLKVVEETGRRLIYLIDDISDFVELKHSEVRLRVEAIALKKIAEPIFRLALGLAENRPISIFDEIPAELKDVRVDVTRFQQILLNLISTAIRYTHSSTIHVKSEIAENGFNLKIIYNGVQPSEAYIDDEETNRDELGALVVRRLAHLMYGRYYYQKIAESQHALCLFLPYTDINKLKKILSAPPLKKEYKTDDGKKLDATSISPHNTEFKETSVLLVSDNAGQIRLLQEQLASIGIYSQSAKNGAEAMGLLQNEHNIALIMSDILLVDVSGIDLTRNIRMLYDIGILPIILIADKNQAGIAASAFTVGANDIIRKPFEKVEVLARVKNMLLQREASLARENYRSLARELEIARNIQESILPIPQPKNNLYKIEAVCLPARSIGGDLYDFIEDETSLGVLLADVAGHGIPAALYAAMLKISFHNLRDQVRHPEKLLKSINEVMLESKERTFISCTYTYLDFKNKRLLHANAGHLPLFVQDPNQTAVKKIQPPGSVLGVRSAATLTVEMIHLKPGTRLTLFTDGVIELTNRKGEFFEEEGLIQVLQEMRNAPLSALKDELLERMREFASMENFLDDVTFLVIDV
ncbi:MAG TPA: SpoIIE family protein phosphatase, partial [Turneriella sp.]|nr:SpoIIE family protein phosphatase [Turneriella sp.]